MLPLNWIDELFKRFEAMYGNQFRQKWDGCDISMVKQEWADALGGTDGETIKRALQACRLNHSFPPSSPEFYQLCKQYRVASHEKFAALPKPNYPKEKALDNLARMKSMLSDSPLMKRFNQQEN